MPISLVHLVSKFPNLAALCKQWAYVVESAELGGGLVQAGVGREDGPASLTLVPNNTTHGDGVVVDRGRSMGMFDVGAADGACGQLQNSLTVPLPVTVPRHTH